MDRLIALTAFPDNMLRDNPIAWEAMSNLAELVGGFDQDRQTRGRLWNTAMWKPHCKVCALGAAVETLVPEEQLVTITSSDPYVTDKLLLTYNQRYEPVDKWSFAMAATALIRLNDSYDCTFAQIRDIVREGKHEFDERMSAANAQSTEVQLAP